MTVRALKKRAAEHGVSAEEEHRRILASVLFGAASSARPTMKEHLMSMPELPEEMDWVFDRNDPRMKIPERAPVDFD